MKVLGFSMKNYSCKSLSILTFNLALLLLYVFEVFKFYDVKFHSILTLNNNFILNFFV